MGRRCCSTAPFADFAGVPARRNGLCADAAAAGQLLDEAGWPWLSGSATRVQSAESETPVFDFAPAYSIRLCIRRLALHCGVGAKLNKRDANGFYPGDDLAVALQNWAFELALVDVRPPADPDLYDFESGSDCARSELRWVNSRQASEALEDGRRIWPS